MKIRKRILAAVLTAIMTISMLPANTFATETVGNEEAESAVEAVSVSTEEQEVETTVEDVSEDITEETSIESSETDEVEETADPAAEETIETVEETVESTEEAEAEEPAAAEPAAEPAVEEAEATDTVDWPVTLEAKGKDYVVAVTYDAEAGIPADAKVEVEEILANDKAYDEYAEQAADKINADVENLSYVRLFDISLVGADGDKLEPTGPVDVKIRLKDVEKADETTQVVHFAGEKEIPEIIDTEIKGKDVFFETDGFSIYAVVVDGEHSSEDRLEVTFDLNGGSINGSKENIVIRVKPDDITDNGGSEFNKIVYDPGMPEAANKKFMGWTTEQNYTDETTPMTIDQVREDIKTRLGSVKEGDTVTYYAMMYNAFELYYANENKVVFNTVSRLSTANSVSIDIKQDYTVTDSTDGFVGWVEQGTENPVYTVGQQINITMEKPQVILNPKLGPGKWLYFDGNDGGSTAADTASYTPPAFIPENTPATAYEPEKPHRLGYTFDGWYTEAEGGTKFSFDQTIDAHTTIYAHWTPDAQAEYTVIVWAQSVDDDKNAADANKTYDYVAGKGGKFTVDTGTKITEELLASNGFLGYGNSDFGVTDLRANSTAFRYRTFTIQDGVGADEDEVSPLGNTVVNVYYDRKLMTIQFRGASGATQHTWYEEVANPTGSEVYALVDGEYVRLGRNVVEKKAQWVEFNGTKVYNPTEIYKRNASSATSVDAIMSYSANANILDSADGTTYGRIGPGNNHTLYTSTSSDYAQMYLDSNNSTRVVVKIKAVYGYTLNGEEYTGPFYEKKSGNVLRYTGLYGQELSKYEYEWPDPDSTWWSIAYLGSFSGNLFGDPTLDDDTNNSQGIANTIKTYKTNSIDKATLVFYVQDSRPDHESDYTRVATAGYQIRNNQGFNITERFIGAEPVSYAWSNSSATPTSGWVNATGGYTSDRDGDYLHIRYDRVKSDIEFVLGTESVGKIEGVPFGRSLSGYEDHVPADPEVSENQYFKGWYQDPEGTKEFDWSGNMPLGDVRVYGITAPVQYHVVIDMNQSADETVTFPADQKLEFWLDYGETISGATLMRATKEGNNNNKKYSIIGYYTENAVDGKFDNNTLWNFDARITEQSLAVKYTGPNDPARVEYGDNGWDGTVGVFKLYANWRNDSLIASGGIHIKYTSTKDGTTTTYEDTYGYADKASVIVRPEPDKSIWPEGKRFAGWKLGTDVYLPGQTFQTAEEAAQVVDGKYYMTLTAEYVDVEKKTPTYIVWYKNDGSEGDAAIHHKSEALDINQATNVPPAPTRAGYKFLGWAKDTERENEDDQPKYSTNKTESDFLDYDYNEGKYYLHGTTDKVVTQVAADDVLPYEALYAIWQPQYIIYHSAKGEKEVIDPADLTDGKLNLTGKVTPGYMYGGYYHYTEDGDHKGAAYTEESGLSMTPVAGTTYYLKEVSTDYLKPNFYLIYNKDRYNGLIQKLFVMYDVDNADDYLHHYLVIDGTNEQEITDFATNSIEVTSEGKHFETLTAKALFGVDSAAMGFYQLDGDQYIQPGKRIDVSAFYVTKDNVKVTGPKNRRILLTSTDLHNGKPTFTGWTSKGGNTRIGIVNKTTEPVAYVASAKRTFSVMRTMMIAAPSEKIEYTITKVYDSGTEEEIFEEGDYTGAVSYQSKDGYLFAGWYEDSAYTTPADFSNVSSDMTVYAKYVKKTDISATFSRKSQKSGTTTFNAAVSVKGQADLENVTLNVKGSDAVLDARTVKKSGSGKNIKYTTQYKGTAAVEKLSAVDSFTASVSWTTPDGTVVSGPSFKCTYFLGLVTVR